MCLLINNYHNNLQMLEFWTPWFSLWLTVLQ